jgi:hypothetical protein
MIQSPEEFVRLRKSSDPEEYRLAANEPAPLSVWEGVVEKFPEMKIWVIHNKTIPIEILRQLWQDPDPLVREAIARKRKCPGDILMSFARDEDLSVRIAVAYNEKTPKDALDFLTNDTSASVSEIAKARLGKP